MLQAFCSFGKFWFRFHVLNEIRYFGLRKFSEHLIFETLPNLLKRGKKRVTLLGFWVAGWKRGIRSIKSHLKERMTNTFSPSETVRADNDSKFLSQNPAKIMTQKGKLNTTFIKLIQNSNLFCNKTFFTASQIQWRKPKWESNIYLHQFHGNYYFYLVRDKIKYEKEWRGKENYINFNICFLLILKKIRKIWKKKLFLLECKSVWKLWANPLKESGCLARNCLKNQCKWTEMRLKYGKLKFRWKISSGYWNRNQNFF